MQAVITQLPCEVRQRFQFLHFTTDNQPLRPRFQQDRRVLAGGPQKISRLTMITRAAGPLSSLETSSDRGSQSAQPETLRTACLHLVEQKQFRVGNQKAKHNRKFPCIQEIWLIKPASFITLLNFSISKSFLMEKKKRKI